MPSTERLVDAVTPLGAALWFRQMTGTEALSIPFEFDVVFHADKRTPSLSAKAMLGEPITLKVETEGGNGIRPFNGICTRFGNAGREGEHLVYIAKLRPWLWIASRRSDCKIFQFKTVPEIIDDVLSRYGYPLENKLTRTYRAWDYCVQYQETDMNFVMRLMEHEGIYFYFKHAEGNHTMVLMDDMARHAPLPGKSTIKYIGIDAVTDSDEEHFNSWVVREEVDPGEYFSDDYDFKNPKADLKINNANVMQYSHAKYQRYEWPGGYVKHADGEDYVKLGLQTLQAEQERCQGHTTVRTMAPGYTYTLDNCPRKDQNRPYLAVATTYFFRDNARLSSGSGEGDADWGITVTSQPTSMPYRPQMLTPKPLTHGPQTALVVGPAGDEIYTDEYSRVKVQFYWDRYGKKNQDSSCWIRVATPWAGEKWGMIHIPRIGHEVVVDFLGGDPDYPLITGSVYNADLMPPYALPDNKTASGLKSRSTKGGGPTDFNEIRMEDMKGKEQLYIHAQKNHDTVVELDESRTVGNNRQSRINNDDSRFVKGTDTHVVTRSQTNQIDEHQTNTIKKNQDTRVTGNQSNMVKGHVTQHVEMNLKESTDGEHMETVSGRHNFSVGRDEINTIGGHQTNKVIKGRNTFITGDDTTTVAGGKTTLMSMMGYSVNAGAHYAETAMLRTSDISGIDVTKIKGVQTTDIMGARITSVKGGDITTVTGGSVLNVTGAAAITVTGGVLALTSAGALTITGAAIAITGVVAVTGVTQITGAVSIVGAVIVTGPVTATAFIPKPF